MELFRHPTVVSLGKEEISRCHFTFVKVSVAQSCLTLCNPMNCSLPGSSVHGILQARILKWVAIPFSKGSSWPRDQTWVSYNAGRFFSLSHQGSPREEISRCHFTFKNRTIQWQDIHRRTWVGETHLVQWGPFWLTMSMCVCSPLRKAEEEMRDYRLEWPLPLLLTVRQPTPSSSQQTQPVRCFQLYRQMGILTLN